MTENIPTYPDLAGKVAGGSGGIGAVVDEIRSDGGQGLPGLRERFSFASTVASRLRTDADHTGGSITKRLLLYR